MYIRLRKRIEYYVLFGIILVLLGKIILPGKNQCPSSSVHEDIISDRYNLNDHHIGFDVIDYVERRQKSLEYNNQVQDWGPHQLGVVIPFRTRFEELKEFLPYMDDYLTKKKIKHKFFVVNQFDTHRFNRASLINVGFLVARNESCDYIAMHDVDLLPQNEDLDYRYPEKGPFHVAAPHLHPKYHYKTFVGGILIVSAEHFEILNGMSNKFWGWGREDDEFYMRIVEKGFQIFRHGDEIKTGLQTFRHIHGKERKRDHAKLPGQRENMFQRDPLTGLHDLKFEVVKRQELVIDGCQASIIDVVLQCDLDFTPWCDFPKKKPAQNK